MRGARASAGLALALVLGAACSAAPSPPGSRGPQPGLSGAVTSNIERRDYAGSPECARCHAEIAERWSRSPMHRMTRSAGGAEVRAPFGAAVFRFKTDTAVLEEHHGDRYVRLSSPLLGDSLYRVTRVIGGRCREDFAGVAVADTRAGSPPLGGGHDEKILPVSYAIGPGELRYKGYSVMATERPGMRAAAVWNQSCIFCHNTVPYLSTVLGAFAGPGAPSYQGEVVDALLPEPRRQPLEILDQPGFDAAMADELRHLGAAVPAGESGPALVRRAISATRRAFGEKDLVELGIGCESCHGGSRQHADDPRLLPSFEPKSAFLRARSPTAASRASAINRACARCHQVLFSRYPYTWEGGERAGAPGGSHINSGEARDFLLGGCSGAMSCADCHAVHGDRARAGVRATETPAGNVVCVRCHQAYREPSAQRAHSHHDPEGEGGACVRCHMPRKNMSLDMRLTPYHRVGSPTDRARVEGDRPLECALCHEDKSVGELVESMERWWGKSFDRRALVALYGSLDANVMAATLRLGKPHEQAPALFILGQTKRPALAPLLAASLTHRFPILRYYARDALELTLGERSPVNLNQESSLVRQEAAAWLGRHGLTLGGAPAGSGPSAPPDDE